MKLTDNQLQIIYDIEAARINKLIAFRRKLRAAKKAILKQPRPLHLTPDF